MQSVPDNGKIAGFHRSTAVECCGGRLPAVFLTVTSGYERGVGQDGERLARNSTLADFALNSRLPATDARTINTSTVSTPWSKMKPDFKPVSRH